MIARSITRSLRELARQYPVVTVTGPRQSGKTTLVKAAFPRLPHVSLEDPDVRDFARTDPRRFIATWSKGAILDEVQRVPDLLSYLQTEVDRDETPGRFVLTGSANILLLKAVSQSLAGRVALLTLLPLSLKELRDAKAEPADLETMLFRGFYPRIHAHGLGPTAWYAGYVTTFLERDVREILAIGDLERFRTFLRMCAARSGQLLNLSALGNDVGVTHNTARSWLSVLETCYIVHRLPPFHGNLGKRLIKTPKLYFLDTGLLCYLLGIHDAATLAIHSHRGAIFESWVCSELLKSSFNRARVPVLHFWRDHAGREVDFLAGDEASPVAIEAKSGATVAQDWFKGIRDWRDLSGRPSGPAWVVHGGERVEPRSEVRVVGWRSLGESQNLLATLVR
jgi:predicted AAA+ superfamily ATPase